MIAKPTYAEFFCGGGMVHAALQASWTCAFANDIDPMKCNNYRENWPNVPLHHCDIRDLNSNEIYQPIDLYWASSPCQDFSLAGKGLGLAGERSGLFGAWMDHVERAKTLGVAPKILAFENVRGLLTRNKGADLQAIVERMAKAGYRVGGLEIDARYFVPQSRPRLFLIGVRDNFDVSHLTENHSNSCFHTPALKRFVRSSSRLVRRNWIWWRHGQPNVPQLPLHKIIDVDEKDALFSREETNKLVEMMTANSRSKLKAAQEMKTLQVGMAYKRGRPDEFGRVRQRAEVRFDGLAGCLRTPAGGSSRQIVLLVKETSISARLLKPREAIRLMGLDDSYKIPERYNDGYKIAGDGVVVDIVSWLDGELLKPIMHASGMELAA